MRPRGARWSQAAARRGCLLSGVGGVRPPPNLIGQRLQKRTTASVAGAARVNKIAQDSGHAVEVGALGEDVGKLGLGHLARLVAAMAAAFGQSEQRPDRIEGETQFAGAAHECETPYAT